MTDLRTTTEPKSDQLNADSLIGGNTLTIKVTKVSLSGAAEQPIVINYENDNGRPYKPCKSMRRVLVHVWGPDGNAYVGRSMTLYCDDKVVFGGMAVGGIRISHMSHIDAPVTMALTATRASRKPFTVKPLATKGAPLPPAKSSPEQSTTQAPPDGNKDAEYHDRIKTALRAIYGDDREAALAKVEELTTWEKDGKVIKGNRDFTKKTGKGAEILCHQIEKLAGVRA